MARMRLADLLSVKEIVFQRYFRRDARGKPCQNDWEVNAARVCHIVWTLYPSGVTATPILSVYIS